MIDKIVFGIESFLINLLAGSVLMAFTEGREKLNASEKQNLQSIREKSKLLRPNEVHFEISIADAIRELHQTRFENYRDVLFKDIEFRRLLINWAFALEENQKNQIKLQLQKKSEKLLGSEDGKNLSNLILQLFERVINSNPILKALIERTDRQEILSAIIKQTEKISLFEDFIKEQFEDIKGILHEIRIDSSKLSRGTENQKVYEQMKRYSHNEISTNEISIPIIGTIERIESAQLVKLALDKQNVLVIGEAGSGKSGILAMAVRRLLDENECVLFICADRLKQQSLDLKSCTADDISKMLAFDRSLIEILDGAKEFFGRCWLFIDQFDQVVGTPLGAALFQVINNIKGRDGVNLVLSCRSYEAQFLGEVGIMNLESIHSAGLPPEVVRGKLEILNVKPTEKLLEICSNLLNLSLLARIIEKQNQLPEITTEVALWYAYQEELSKREGNDVLKAAYHYAQEVVCSDSDTFHKLGEENAKRLASFGVLSEIKIGLFKFRHEYLRDYFFTYHFIINLNENAETFIAKVSPIKSKMLISWAIKILGNEFPDDCADFISDLLTSAKIKSPFSIKACLQSLNHVNKVSKKFAQTIWELSCKRPDIALDFRNNRERVITFWQAGIHKIAERSLQESSILYELFENVNIIAEEFPDEFVAWVSLIDKLPKYTGGILEGLSFLPCSSTYSLVTKILGWYSDAPDKFYKETELMNWGKKLVDSKYYNESLLIFSFLTEPVLVKPRTDWQKKQYPFGRIAMRWHHPFPYPVIGEPDKEKRFWGLPIMEVIKVFENHLKTLIEILKKTNQYENWAGIESTWNLKDTLRHGFKQDTIIGFWPAFLAESLIEFIKLEPQISVKKLKELFNKNETVYERIGLYVLAHFNSIPGDCLNIALDKGLISSPENLRESIFLLQNEIENQDISMIERISKEMWQAIYSMDVTCLNNKWHWHIPGGTGKIRKSAEERISQGKKKLKFLKKVVNWLRVSTESKWDLKKEMPSWDLENYIEYVELCFISKVKPSGYTSSGGRIYENAILPFVSLHEAADRVYGEMAKRWESLFKNTNSITAEIVEKSIGYTILLAGQCAASWGKSIPVTYLIDLYEPVIESKNLLAPAIRAQFAAFLAVLTDRNIKPNVKNVLPRIGGLLERLCSCEDPGCVRPTGVLRLFHLMTHFPPSTAAISLYGLIEYLWRIYGPKHNLEKAILNEFFRMVGKKKINSRKLPDRFRTLIYRSFQIGLSSQEDVLLVFGNVMAALFVLDSEWLMKIFRDHETKYLYKLFSVIHTFSNFHFSYVMYPFLRIFYEKMIEHKKIGEAEISQIAKAYLINMETLDNKENLMSKIIRTENQSDIAHLAESICDTYDQWGHEKWMWKKVRSYWENRVSEWDGKHSEEMAAFARVFEESRRGISEDEDSIKLHIPECFEMLYKLLKPLCYSMPNTSYSSRERISAVVGYLSNECHGFEEITIELFALCIGYDSENYDKYEVESRPGIKILETCLAKGGDARKKAIEIIEKHETRGNQSLSYLISNYDI